MKNRNDEHTKELTLSLLRELDELSSRLASFSTQALAFEKALTEYSGIPGKTSECQALYDRDLQQLYLFIPVAPPYLKVVWNRWPGQTNYRQVRQLWYSYVENALRDVVLPLEPFERAVVAFKFTWGDSRVHDVDNYAVKFIIDALVRNGIIAGDNCEKLALMVLGEKGDFWSTQIIVTPGLEQVLSVQEAFAKWEEQALAGHSKTGNTNA
ncbi:hypothetical protein V3F56_02850 [Moorellaceae bacterium AZ2]